MTSGGVSVGEEDHVKPAVEAEGSLLMWKIAMKPGRPLAFGRVKDAAFIGLPGNPVSVMVTFYHFVRGALLYMAGRSDTELPLLRARSETAMRKKPGRTEYQRGIVESAGGKVIIVPIVRGKSTTALLAKIARP